MLCQGLAEQLDITQEEVLGIRRFCEENVQYYYAGYVGASLQTSLARACRIRMVCLAGSKLQFERYLPLPE